MSQISLKNYMDKCRDKIVEHCSECGSCIANCEINRFTSLKDTDPVQIINALIAYLRTGKYEQIVYDFAFQCINCLECTIHCPEGIEASAIPALVKDRLVREGYEAPPMFKMVQPCAKHSVQEMIGALQIAPSEKWWIDEVPENPEPHDIVLFLGCNEIPFPATMAATRDIMAAMGLDFISVAGGKELCCGAIHLNTGELSKAHDMAHHLVESLDRFQPKTVVFTCPTCVYVIQKSAKESEKDAVKRKYQHFPKFLGDRLDKIRFKKPLRQKMTVQDPCFTSRGLGDYDSPRKVLSAIEGVELVEMAHSHENALCCGITATANNTPEVAGSFISERLREARNTGAKTVVSVCAGCQMAYFSHEKEFGLCAKGFSDIVAEAMGIALQPDKMKEFSSLGEPGRILEAARETIAAGQYSEEELGLILPFLFPPKQERESVD